MGGFLELLSTSAKVWVNNPLEFAAAIIVGVLVGYLLSRLRHQGTIQAQKERLEHKDDVIKFKDQAVAAASKMPPYLGTFAMPDEASTTAQPLAPPPATPPSPASLTASRQESASEDPRFRVLNAQIIAEAEAIIRRFLKGGIFEFVFNPKSGQKKLLSFKDNGEIGNGQNQNEHTWRIRQGRLEILNDRGELYSRFFFLPEQNALHHTNDPDTRSIKGQYMTRLKPQPFVPAGR